MEIYYGGYVFTGISLFVSRIMKKCVFDGKVAHGSLKEQLDLGSNPNRIMLGLWLVRWVHYYVPCGYVLPGIHLTVTTL